MIFGSCFTFTRTFSRFVYVMLIFSVSLVLVLGNSQTLCSLQSSGIILVVGLRMRKEDGRNWLLQHESKTLSIFLLEPKFIRRSGLYMFLLRIWSILSLILSALIEVSKIWQVQKGARKKFIQEISFQSKDKRYLAGLYIGFKLYTLLVRRVFTSSV